MAEQIGYRRRLTKPYRAAPARWNKMELEPRNIRGIVFHLDPSLKSLLAEIVAPIGGFAIFPCALPDRGFSLLRFEHWHRAPRLRFQPLATVRPGILISYAEKIDWGAVSESNRKKFKTPYPTQRSPAIPLPAKALPRTERTKRLNATQRSVLSRLGFRCHD
jgi:hypothetical protein